MLVTASFDSITFHIILHNSARLVKLFTAETACIQGFFGTITVFVIFLLFFDFVTIAGIKSSIIAHSKVLLSRYRDADKVLTISEQVCFVMPCPHRTGLFLSPPPILRAATRYMMNYKSTLLSQEDIERILRRISHQIIEKNQGTDNLCLIGIHTRGVPLAYRIAADIKAIEGASLPVGELDITLYRDDLSLISETPAVKASRVDFDVTGKTVVLVDDVIYTGRTARAALDAVMKLGRPAKVQLCVLIDRGHSELPIKANFVGKNIPTSVDEVVAVRLRETDVDEAVKIYIK